MKLSDKPASILAGLSELLLYCVVFSHEDDDRKKKNSISLFGSDCQIWKSPILAGQVWWVLAFIDSYVKSNNKLYLGKQWPHFPFCTKRTVPSVEVE